MAITTHSLRPLHIRFDIFTNGYDLEFKYKLVSLMMASLSELRDASLQSFQVRNADIFRKALHKAKSTLVLLDDAELNSILEQYRTEVIEAIRGSQERTRLKQVLTAVLGLCDSVIESLRVETETMKRQL